MIFVAFVCFCSGLKGFHEFDAGLDPRGSAEDFSGITRHGPVVSQDNHRFVLREVACFAVQVREDEVAAGEIHVAEVCEFNAGILVRFGQSRCFVAVAEAGEQVAVPDAGQAVERALLPSILCRQSWLSTVLVQINSRS